MIYIRADANPNIGMGHIMRCLSIADAASNLDQDITFILADDRVLDLVQSRGYTGIILNTDYRNMDAELDRWPPVSFDVIIVDSYFVTESYLKFLKSKTEKLVYIDDLASFHYPVDILVNYNAYGIMLNYHSLYNEADVQEPYFILGPTYAPLRSMFRGLEKKIQPKTVKNVLISTGGADSEHIALSIVKAKPSDYTYHLLIGALNSDKEEIRKLAAEQESIVLHENVSDTKSLICSTDIAVSAAGSTLYEICACGIPLITYILADNQIPGAEAFEKLSLSINLGDIRNVDESASKILTAINCLADDYEKRCEVGSRMQEMIDGFGADRMVEKMMATPVRE